MEKAEKVAFLKKQIELRQKMLDEVDGKVLKAQDLRDQANLLLEEANKLDAEVKLVKADDINKEIDALNEIIDTLDPKEEPLPAGDEVPGPEVKEVI